MEKTIGILSMERMMSRVLNSVGSSRIRVRWLLPYWEEAEEYIIGKKYEVLIFQKVYWDTFFKYGDYRGIKILDLCDPDFLENKPVFEYIDKMDAVVTSTEELAKYIRKLRPNAIIKCIPDRVYLQEAIPIKEAHSEELKTVAWYGYSRNTMYLERTFEELIKRNIELTIISDSQFDLPMRYRNKIKIQNVTYNYSSLNGEIVKYDAVLMPDPFGDERAKYKSNNKTVQAWAIGMPVIKEPDDFERLASKESRIEEAKKNLEIVKNEYDVRLSCLEYRQLINELKEKKNVKPK